MDIFLVPFLHTLLLVLFLYRWTVLIGLILYQLIIFRIVNPYQSLIYSASRIYYTLTEPCLKRLRPIFPMVMNIDITPVVLLLSLYFFEHLLVRLLIRLS